MQNVQKNAGKLSCSFHKIMKMKKKYTDSYRLFVLKSNRKENQEKMFEVGEYIVYGCKGVCQVEEITHIDIPGSNKDRLYYVLAPLEDRNGKIYAPTDNAKVAMRKVITRWKISFAESLRRSNLGYVQNIAVWHAYEGMNVKWTNIV